MAANNSVRIQSSRDTALSITTVRGVKTKPFHQDLARLRMDIFKDFPYLYAGNSDYEATYNAIYGQSPNSLFVIVKAFNEVIGISTALPIKDMDESLAFILSDQGYPATQGFYLGESVLSPHFRGRGLYKKMFALREEEARLQGHAFTAFLSVVRENDHPLRPLNYVPHDTTWQNYGYTPTSAHITFSYPSVPLPNLKCVSGWSKHGTTHDHMLQF
jgi:GNAT superfamily N-acetyltransferase